MELKATKYLDQQEYIAFFDQTMSAAEYEQQKEGGYFIYQGETPIAFFSLIAVEEQLYWLRSLIIKRHAPILLPVTIIQSAEQIAFDNKATHLVTHSTSGMLDELFTQLGYQPSEKDLDSSLEAKWWITNLANVGKKRTYTQI
ncbi:hypothetical protein [Gracilibacillus alcaliphilus]|uniref:hypothetical protein n=1 Tax=Gracilibacillus alcaliphilus TaxID=1401441 RepID=UPI00195914C6|nr:hypothetical protein [Gracilibacillus alcaliphilus]MBM7677216.1 hypothetical protein [Gracilibacillus alcaliphilus]